jgi:TPR repeat protein
MVALAVVGYSSPVRRALSFLLLTGCAQLGNAAQSTLPRDVHAPPDARDRADHPCRYGDTAQCIARCEAGDAQTCNAAGVLFEFDAGESTDPALASGFYRRSCDANYAPGCNNLAWLYLRGRGVAHDPPRAMVLFLAAFDAARLACGRGDASGCLLAGEILYDGRAGKKDDEEAAGLFAQACDGGETRACAMEQ